MLKKNIENCNTIFFWIKVLSVQKPNAEPSENKQIDYEPTKFYLIQPLNVQIDDETKQKNIGLSCKKRLSPFLNN